MGGKPFIRGLRISGLSHNTSHIAVSWDISECDSLDLLVWWAATGFKKKLL